MEAIVRVPVYPIKLKGASPEMMALGQAYIDSNPTLSETSRTRKQAFLNTIFEFFHDDVPNITHDRFNAFKAWMRNDKKYRSENIRRTIGTTFAFLHYLHAKGIRKEPVKFDRLISIPRDKSRATAFTEDQYIKLLEAAAEDDPAISDYWPSAIIIGWNTGLRISDVNGLTWSSVDFKSGVIRLKPQKMRHTDQYVEIPIEPELKAHLEFLYEQRDAVRPSPFVLPTMVWQAEEHYSDRALEFRRICNKAGIPKNYSFKSFRHAFITRLFNAQADAEIIGSITGQSKHTVYTYVRHISHATKVRAMERARQVMIEERSQPMKIELPPGN